MSTGPRLPLAAGRHVADRLMAALNLREPEAAVVGSVRRGKPDVGDIEIIAPMESDNDRLYRRIGETFDPPESPKQPGLWTAGGASATTAQTFGRIVQGHNPYFKECTLDVWLKPSRGGPLDGLPTDAHGRITVRCTIYRYIPGDAGNRGWIEVMRTGNSDFSEAVLRGWKWVCGTLHTSEPGSAHGFLVDRMGNRRPTPTEFHVFQLIGCLWVTPEKRTSPDALCRASEPFNRSARERAMKHLGIASVEEIAERWGQDRLAASGGANGH